METSHGKNLRSVKIKKSKRDSDTTWNIEIQEPSQSEGVNGWNTKKPKTFKRIKSLQSNLVKSLA